MIVEIQGESQQDLISFFEANRYLQLISKSILKQGLGTVYVDDRENPKVAMLVYKFLIFFAGEEKHPAVTELFSRVPQRFLLFVPDGRWSNTLKEYWGEKLKSRERTKFSSESLTIERMDRILERIPQGTHLEILNDTTINNISDQAKGIITLLFPDLNDFMKTNFGYCLMDGERIVSLALAATPIEDGNFEIHIETDPEYQKRGLAMISAAQLIRHSLQEDLTPHWDADNPPSAKLAKKLGFTNPEVYHTYFWMDS